MDESETIPSRPQNSVRSIARAFNRSCRASHAAVSPGPGQHEVVKLGWRPCVRDMGVRAESRHAGRRAGPGAECAYRSLRQADAHVRRAASAAMPGAAGRRCSGRSVRFTRTSLRSGCDRKRPASASARRRRVVPGGLPGFRGCAGQPRGTGRGLPRWGRARGDRPAGSG